MPAPLAVAPAPNAPAAAPAVKPAAPAAPTQNAPPADEPLFEVKIGGELRKFKKSEAERMLSKAGFADKTIQQAKEALKAAADLRAKMAERESVWDDDERLEAELAKRGKLDKLARKRLEAKLQEQEMTPEQRKAEEKEAENADLKKKLAAVEEEKAQQQLSANAQRIQKRVEGVLGDAWQRAGFEQGDSEAFFAVYEVMNEWNDLGLLPKGDEFTSAIADQVVEAARENIEKADKRREAAVLKGLKGKALIDRLGKATVDEVLRWKVEELRGGGAKKTNGTTVQKPNEPQQFISPQEALKKMRGIP